MTRQHHFEVIVEADDEGVEPTVYLNSEDSATWWDGHVYDTDSYVWTDEGCADGEDDSASWQVSRTLELPAKIVNIYRQHTGPNGWDINIMSDIMGLLVEGGWVKDGDVIHNGPWPDDDGLVNGIPTSMLILPDN